jgi:tetratricopeptide (TPR) repeat protein
LSEEEYAKLHAAIETLNRAIELSPHRIQPRLLLAKVYSDDHDYPRAQAVLEDAIKDAHDGVPFVVWAMENEREEVAV